MILDWKFLLINSFFTCLDTVVMLSFFVLFLNIKKYWGSFLMVSHLSTNICDLDKIYNSGYEFSLPKNFLSSYLSGNSFDYKKEYTPEEAKGLNTDINQIFRKILSENPVKKKEAVLTAGAPGAGKTILLEQDRKNNPQVFAYTDPDAVCLLNMHNTYLSDLNAGMSMKDAYDKWRPGSNASNQLNLAHLILNECAFYFGTTSTSPQTYKFFEFLKQRGYQIRIIHLSAPNNVRWESIQKREENFVQSTEKDVIEKGKALPERINDYLKYADGIDFYYRGESSKDAVLAAHWETNKHMRYVDQQGDLYSGLLNVKNPEAYDKIQQLHDLVINELKKEKPGMQDLTWKSTVEKGVLYRRQEKEVVSNRRT